MMKWELSIFGSLALSMVLFLAVANTAQANAGGMVLEKEIDGHKVTLILANGEPRTGQNSLAVEIHDAQGQPVAGAMVTVTTEMNMESGNGAAANTASTGTPNPGSSGSNMSGTMDMGSSDGPKFTFLEPSSSEPGAYEGDLIFDYAGQWTTTVTFFVNNQERSATFALDVAGKTSRHWLVIGGILGLNAAVIFAAAVMKRRKPVAVLVTKDQS